jgi:prepilin-type processing-associated H-X9-DG protein
MDVMTYEVLSWLAAGNSVFRPREATREAEEAFRGAVSLLNRLRDQGMVAYQDGHVAQAGSGIYLMVGPVLITERGKAALERDRSLGDRGPRQRDPLPWRS